MFDMIAFGADDTLWHSERLYVAAQGKLEWYSGGRIGSTMRIVDLKAYFPVCDRVQEAHIPK